MKKGFLVGSGFIWVYKGLNLNGLITNYKNYILCIFSNAYNILDYSQSQKYEQFIFYRRIQNIVENKCLY